MAKSRSTARPKYRKHHQTEAVPVEVNQRQVATATMATSGETGADVVARLSDVLQANGKLLITLVLVGLAVAIFFIVRAGSAEASSSEFRQSIERAARLESTKDVRKAFDGLATQVKDNPQDAAQYYYRYAGALWEKIQQDRDASSEKARTERNEVLKLCDQYFGLVATDPARAIHEPEMQRLKQSIQERNAFLESDSRSVFDERSTFKTPIAPRIVEAPENPRIAFSTNHGEFSIELFEEPALRNSVNSILTLVERGYYRNTSPFLYKRPGVGSHDELLFSGLSTIGFGERGWLPKVEKKNAADTSADLTEEEKEKEADEKKKKSQDRPSFTIRPERLSQPAQRFSNTRGKVFLYFELGRELRLGAQFGVNLADNTRLDSVFQVVGQVATGLDVLDRLTPSDRIYDAWIVQKRNRDYTPDVIMLEGEDLTGIPRPWVESTVKPETPTIARIEKPEIADDKNPRVVISTDRGDFEVELFEDQVPNTVANFIYLVESGHYTDSSFHRVETGGSSPDSMRLVQGGRRKSERGEEEEAFDWVIRNEAVENDKYDNLRNATGTLAMERQGALDTAGCQFFVNLKNYPKWDDTKSPYCVFGTVTKNLWTLYDIKPKDKIKGAWVVRKRNHAYIPEVKKTGEATWAPVKKSEASEKSGE